MSSNTTTPEQQASLEYQRTHLHEDRGPEVLAACVVSIVFCVLAVILRIWAQSLIHKTFTPDSILIYIAAVIAIATAACTIAAVQSGLGKHQMGYIVTVLQAAALMFTKLSILLFYQRAFTTVLRPVKWTIWILFYYCIGLGIGSTVEFICACIPPQMFWLRVYPIFGYELPEPLEENCLPQQMHLGVPLLLDLASEIVMLAVPAIVLWNLQLPLRKKIGLTFAFSMGIFVTAISVIRFYYSWHMVNDGDLSWDDTDSFMWTSVQVCFGITTACIPACAPLLRMVQAHTTRKATYGSSFKSNFTSHLKPKAETDSVMNLAQTSWDDVERVPWTRNRCEIRSETPARGAPPIQMQPLGIQVSHDVQWAARGP
ncbi:hypothetical protein N8T08_005098 [Aspergillus melleus]|uniref:Uncharacterized protein n=1 Tax=Aspergillus melleus TaxID=138277 RepID=A0ACC3BFB7_9EURO|nr:hypothetical protein N8T08_005098 [Aspergillus melleus]